MKHFPVFLALVATGFFLGCEAKSSPAPDANATSNTTEVHIVDLSANDAQVQADIRAIAKAGYEHDVPTVLKYTHPKIIAAMGGQTQAESTMETFFAKIGPMKLKSFKFPEAPTYLETDRNYYVIVPTLSIMSLNGQRVESLNYQLGMRKKDAVDWKYVEGSRVNQGNVRSLFPDFPPDFKFPEFYRKRI